MHARIAPRSGKDAPPPAQMSHVRIEPRVRDDKRLGDDPRRSVSEIYEHKYDGLAALLVREKVAAAVIDAAHGENVRDDG